MKDNSDTNKRERPSVVGIIFSLAIGILITVCLVSIVPDALFRHYKYSHPQDYTTTIEPETADRLCVTLEIDANDFRCHSGSIYAYDFYDVFLLRYQRGKLREQIDSEIGIYLTRCDTPTRSFMDGVFQTCEYDFVGDNAFPLQVNYWTGYTLDDNNPDSVSSVCGFVIEKHERICNR